MTGGTDYTPPIDENLLGLSTKEAINEAEAEGLLRAEYAVLNLDEASEISISLLLTLHRLAFGHLYEWAGKWRRMDLKVGRLSPPPFCQVPTLMYQFVDDLNFQLTLVNSQNRLVEIIAWSHHRFVWIHPFTNGNGRTARLLTNLILLLKQYAPIRLYHRDGNSRSQYVTALRMADEGNFKPLEVLILLELKPL